ncbi:DNA-deoxyinosine glycosylase [Candidatus Woesearchaeota archaeon]|nr:DNA-deoxyinosine glycosylase [Candidatus Woesearchaeota archaeon]
MIIVHPFPHYVPRNAEFLIIGSFPPISLSKNDFFYSSKQNQFWKIIESIYKTDIKTKRKKELFLEINNIAMTDIIMKCRRKKGDSSDKNLEIIEYMDIKNILKHNKEIKKIFFTSKFVENIFRKIFSDITVKTLTLPSPSPRYARLSFDQKVYEYKKYFKPSLKQKIYTALLAVPKGKVTTYKELANRVGSKAYRAVGQIMNKNSWAPEVPCHRVVASDGSLGGFAEGLKKKKALLESECVKIINNKIDEKYFYKHK